MHQKRGVIAPLVGDECVGTACPHLADKLVYVGYYGGRSEAPAASEYSHPLRLLDKIMSCVRLKQANVYMKNSHNRLNKRT